MSSLRSLSTAPGMSTFIWGPLFWDLLTDMALRLDRRWKTLDHTQRTSYEKIWHVLRNILPCKWCRQSYRKFLREEPPTFPFLRWIWNVHNKVNLKLQKPGLELDKFQRQCHVYSSFSHPSTWWDIMFILAMNYDPVKKRTHYAQWFKLTPLMMTLVDYKIPCFEASVPSSALASRFSLLRWLAQQHSPSLSLEYAVRKYSQAIAHKTVEELSQLCGPLILRCQKYDKQDK